MLVNKNKNSIEDGATPEESCESIFAEAANRFSSPISMAKPSTMESTGETVEGKVDNKRKKVQLLQHQFLDV